MPPHSRRPRRTGTLAAIVAAALLIVGLLSAGALAAPNPGPPTTSKPDGPQSANVPYVAWIGEHLRLVVCDPAIATKPSSGEGQFSTFAVEDWSGYQFQPPTPDGAEGKNLGEEFEPGPAAFFESSLPAHETAVNEVKRHDGCVATDYKSLNPGLARIRVSIKNQKTGAIVFSHQFLAIWLTANAPTLHEAGATASGEETFQGQLSSTGQSNYANFLGDPAGDGEFTPTPFTEDPSHLDKGLIQIKVTGSFPVVPGVPLSNILKEPSYQLPEAWEPLAKALASSEEDTEPPGTNPGLWDIHGTPEEATTPNKGGTKEGALKELFLRPAFAPVGENYTSGATATVGPYDPQAANETLLSDGKLNYNDAPMPSIRLDVQLAKNKEGSDLGGAGEYTGASKAQIYSHNFNGNTEAGAEEAGNLYNPFYGAYIPATDRPGVNEVSGVTGPSPGGDFPGFVNEHPAPYPYWKSLLPRGNVSSESTGCLRRREARPETYETPGGPTTQTFYTDERGEAYLQYTPGDRFYLNHIPQFKGAEGESQEGKIAKNTNGGCDLKGLYKSVIGESSFSASAVYPYEPVDYPAVGSAIPVVKKIRSLWEKEFFSFPKGPGSNEGNVQIVVAKAQDIDGYPLVGEEVCFHAQHEAGIRLFSGEFEDPNELLKKGKGPFHFSGQSVTKGSEGTQFLCVNTNSEGLAAVELENSTFTSVDLTTTYEAESIIRDHVVTFPNNEASRKAAEEKLRRETEEKAEKVKHEEEIAAETVKTEEREKAEKVKHEEEKTAEQTRLKEKAEEEVKKHEEELKREESEHKTLEEIAKKTKERSEEEASNKAAREAEAAANQKHREEEEAANSKKLKEELAQFEAKLRAETEAANKKRQEQEAAEQKSKGGSEKTAAASSGSSSSTSPPASALLAPPPGPGLGGAPVASTATVGPLTRAQKLAKALKACRKLPKKKRASCEAKARKAYGAKKKRK